MGVSGLRSVADAWNSAPRDVDVARVWLQRDAVVDLKYVKDSNGKTRVALIMIDAVTCWHVAVLLRDRKPRHAARKLIEGWIRHYGRPRYIIVDEG